MFTQVLECLCQLTCDLGPTLTCALCQRLQHGLCYKILEASALPPQVLPGGSLNQGGRPGTTLAWPGWKQLDIPVEVDTARLETGQFKKCCIECVLLYYPSTEFESAFYVCLLTWCRSCRVILYKTVHLGVSFFEGGLSAGVD
jgi:hypothetical protein